MVETFTNMLTAEDIAWFKQDLEAKINVDPEDRTYDPADAYYKSW